MYSSEILAEKIRLEAKKQKISQKDLLAKCELGVNTITKLSNGTDILVKNLVKIATELNCSIDYLIGREPSSLQKNTKLSSTDLEFFDKLHSLPEDSQDEIVHMVNYKYEQLQKKRKTLLSNSEMSTDDETHNMLA